MTSKQDILEAMEKICDTSSCYHCMFHLNKATEANDGFFSQCLKNILIASTQKCKTCGREL